MTEQQKALVLLINSALTGEKYSLPDSMDLSDVFDVAKRHGIDVMAYYGALNCGVSDSCDVMREELIRVYKSTSYSETQIMELCRLTEAFESGKIEYMPLKGMILKSLYPKAEMRRMGDADILIRCEQYERIRTVMTELGYEEKYQSDHELAWKKGQVLVELHKRLIPSYNKDYYAYYGDGWKIAKKIGDISCGYTMDPNDEMIYLFTHFAKHYRDAGIGVRHLVDLWVYRRHHSDLDEEYIRAELEKLQLYEFYCNILDTLRCWFDEYEGNDKTEFITQFIFTSGEFGRKENSNLSSALKDTKGGKSVNEVKRERAITLLFPKYSVMSVKYPVLKKAPVLLPVMWVVRAFSKASKIKKVGRTLQNRIDFDSDGVSAYQQSLTFVGLDFNFSE